MRWPWPARRRGSHPACNAYREALRHPGWNRDTLLRDLSIVVLDAETTGTDPTRDRLLSLSAVRVCGPDIVLNTAFDALALNPLGDSGRVSAAVHGILGRETASGESETDIMARFLGYIGPSWLCGHFIGHDLGILNAILDRMDCRPLRSPVLDTAHLYRRWKHGPLPDETGRSEAQSLDRLCLDLDVPVHDRHTAAGDTLMTAMVLIRLLKRLEARGIRRVRDL